MSLPSDPNQDGFEFAGEPAEADASAAILDELADTGDEGAVETPLDNGDAE
jgi:hypothetical protein